MDNLLSGDLERLDRLAFKRREFLESDVRRFHSLRSKRAREVLGGLHAWMFVPVSLWPLNFHHLYQHALDVLERGGRLDADFLALLDGLPPLPDAGFAGAVGEFEKVVEAGRYEDFVLVADKFASIQTDLERNPAFKEAWRVFADRWKPGKRANARGILRRSLSQERDLRGEFDVDWGKPGDRFRAAFDAFCYRWGLYGMRDSRPLVNKIKMNLGGAAGSTSTIQGLVFFKKSNFVNLSGSPISFDSNSQASIGWTEYSATTGGVRAAVLNGTTWYLSNTVGTGYGGNLTITNMAAQTFAAWDPTGAPLNATPGTFSTLGSSFADIQGVGYYFDLSRVDGTAQLAVLNIEFSAVPEPTTWALLGLSLSVVLLFRRRGSRAS